MAIYISGVKNLPEQVQKNKDDIEDLQTADTNLDAKIDQAVADRKEIIDASGNNIIIKNPTEKVAVLLSETESSKNFAVLINGTPKFDIDETSVVANEDTAVNGEFEAYGDIKGHSDLAIDNNITAGGDITATGDITGDLVKANTLESNAVVSKSDSDTIQFTAFASGVPHILEFNASNQALTIDGQAVGGKQLYQHNVYVKGVVSGRYYWVFATITNDDPTAFTTFNSFKDYINTNYPAYNKGLSCSGYVYDGANDLVAVNVYKGATNSGFSIQYINPAGHNVSSYEYFSSATDVVDNVLAI